MDFYNTYILPKLIHWVCSQNDITEMRRDVVPLAKGKTLEVGMGSGLNLPFYDPLKIDKVFGLEPLEILRKKARKKADGLPFEVDFVGRSGEEIPLDDCSVDTVLVTYTLCSIPDVLKALKEMKRVLRPDGSLIFCEHGQAPDRHIHKWQEKINTHWTKISGGCNLNRHIADLIRESGFEIVALDTKYNSAFKLVSYNYRGVAVPKQ